MPQRQDPIVPVRTAVVATPYPGARPEKVEQEVTRKVERKVAENSAVEHVYSISRPGCSFVFVDLFDSAKDADSVWMDLRQKLAEIPDLPRINGQPMQPYLDTDFGDTVAVMLTISSPPVDELEIKLREKTIRQAIETVRAQAAPEYRSNRITGVLVYPRTVAHDVVHHMGQRLSRFLFEQGMGRDTKVVEAPGAAMLDFQLLKSLPELDAALHAYENEDLLLRDWHPDVWPGFLVQDPGELHELLRRHAPDKYTYRELRQYNDRIRDVLKKYPTVGKVTSIGLQPEQVSLFYSGQRFENFGLSPELVMQRLQARNTNLPGGSIDLPHQKIEVRPSGEFLSEQEIGNVVVSISADGAPLYLRDIVDVVRGYADPPSTMNFRTIKITENASEELQTRRAVTLAIRQIKGTQIQQFAKEIDAALVELQHELPPDLRIERTSNEPEEVQHKIAELNQNLLEAVLIVVACALLFMEWRSAMLVATAIPLTIAMTLGVVHLFGIDIQQVSIAALVIALGMLVDSPVVAADAINRELAAGTQREKAAWFGPAKLNHALLFATITLCVAFLPLLLIQGKTGDFIYSLPVIVSISLVCARLCSMTFTPMLGYYLLRGQKSFAAEVGTQLKGFPAFYHSFANFCIRHKSISLGVACMLFVAAVALLPLIGTGFFPKDLHDVFTVNVFMPEGTPIKATRDETQRILRVIEKLAGRQIESYTTFVGAGGPRFWLSVAPEMPADCYAQILVRNTNKKETAGLVERLKWKLPQHVSSARITVEQLETGPPIGIPVQVRLYGAEMPTLRRLAAAVKREMVMIHGTANIHDDWDPEIMQVSLNVDPDRASITGITNQDLAMTMYTGLSGYAPTQLREGDQLIDISLRLRGEERSQLADLYNLSAISSLTNTRVPFRQISEGRYEMIPSKIRRRDHARCLTVKCDAAPGTLPSALVKELKKRLPALALPPGYRFEFGGEDFEQNKGFADVQVALIVSLIAIYIALVLQFESLTKPLLVFAAVPFGMVAGVLGLLLFKANFGFMAFLGIASLAGLIVSNIIVLFDFIEEAHRHGIPLRQAVVEAGLARLRPVLVTVLATVGGLVPLALRGGPLWEPMCYVQIVGLLCATLVTLVLVPVLYVLFVETLHLIKWAPPAPCDGAGAADSQKSAHAAP
jgi:multidrug efflux pump subunit AcrB